MPKTPIPNGSINDIAGIINEKGNVLGLMPHPENLIEAAHGGSDGRALFESALGIPSRQAAFAEPDAIPIFHGQSTMADNGFDSKGGIDHEDDLFSPR